MLIGPKYLIIVLDDLNQNHINNGLIGITELSKTLKLPTYYSRDLPVRCTSANPMGTNFDANTEFLVDDINAGTLIMDKWDVSYVPTPTVLPTAPRILTQSQIYSINEIINIIRLVIKNKGISSYQIRAIKIKIKKIKTSSEYE